MKDRPTRPADSAGRLPDRGDGVTRRDFIHDLSLAGLLCSVPGLAAEPGAQEKADAGPAPRGDSEVPYPPTLTGLRGSHPGAFEAAHALAREGRRFRRGEPTAERYDLVVVGGGISGLAAAYFYRQRFGDNARILILDNHDDFGGHARRNEFHQGGTMRLAWGGTVNIEHWKYSEVGHRLLRELGIDMDRLFKHFRYNWSDNGTGLEPATWFDRDTYGRDVLIRGMELTDLDPEALAPMIERIPISEAGRASLRRFLDSDRDLLASRSDEERERFLRSTRYADFLRDHAGLTEDAIQIFSASMAGLWGVRADDLSVAECLESGLPGAHLLALKSPPEGDQEVAAMFPDGNASIARLLVRALIPGAFPDMAADSDPFNIVAADLDYGQLDRADNALRLRLGATVLRVDNQEDGVSLSYATDGRLYTLEADRCVLACYNRIIPHICPGLPAEQKAALAQCIKRPLFTVNVLLRDGRAIQRSGVASAYLPGSALQLINVVTGISVGPYRDEWDAQAPCVLHCFSAPLATHPEGLTMVEQNQAARLEMLAMSFEDYEREVHRVLRGVWGSAGLDPERDILAITVNRWPHGYARDLLDLEDPAWLATPGPYEIGRRRFGNIAIANSDAGADAYTHTAIDQAWRAVKDLIA